jgi:biopolymer transport protein ExbD
MKQSMHAKRMERSHKRAKKVSKLNLVSLMDIFTILVFFLLVNSSNVEVLQTDESIELPESVSEIKPEESIVVLINKEDIFVGKVRVASVANVLLDTDGTVEGLKRELEARAARKPYPNEEAAKRGRDISIMADKSTPYTLLKRVMKTSAESEYRNISLAVTQVYQDVSELEAQAEQAAGGG